MQESPLSLETLASDVKKYADLRIDELKLKTVRGLSQALGQVCAMLIIAGVAVIVLLLLSYALLQWLNVLLGAPWGTLIACGLFIFLLIFLIAFKGRMFRDSFVKLFASAFFDADDDE